jgi:hypothetical protein
MGQVWKGGQDHPTKRIEVGRWRMRAGASTHANLLLCGVGICAGEWEVRRFDKGDMLWFLHGGRWLHDGFKSGLFHPPFSAKPRPWPFARGVKREGIPHSMHARHRRPCACSEGIKGSVTFMLIVQCG